MFYPLHGAGFSAHFRRGREGVDGDALLRQAKRLLEEQPRARAELGTAGTCARFVVRPTALGDHFWVDAPGALDLGQDRAALDDRGAGVIDEAWGIANPRLPRLGRTPGPRAGRSLRACLIRPSHAAFPPSLILARPSPAPNP